MLQVTGIDLNPNSREEYLPGYTSHFPHIASRVQGAHYLAGTAPWHWHESVELFYVRRGAILYRTPHCERVMRAGSGGMVNSNVLHSTKILKPEADLELVLHLFSPALVAGVPGGTIEERYIRPLVKDKSRELLVMDAADPANEAALALLCRSFTLDEAAYGYELRLQSMLSEIWLHMVRQADLKSGQPGTEEKAATAAQEKIKQMMVYVNTHYAEKLTVPMLAAAAFCSERECYRAFQSCLHTSPTEYIRTVRLQSACKLLLETDRTVTDIAQCCGFGSSSYFGTQLHAETGCTPTEYRAKWQNIEHGRLAFCHRARYNDGGV